VNQATSRLPRTLLVISLAALSLAAGALAWRVLELRGAPAPEALIVLPEPRVIADFALEDQTGKPFSIDGFRGRWSVLFFGFTSCPDVCPNTLYELQQVRSILQERVGSDRLPAVYLISVDPERDTPEKLAGYLGHFDPSFTGLTGADAQLRALTTQLGIMYHVEPHDPGNREYAVEHSASLLLLDPQARLHGVLPAPHDAEQIAGDLLTILDRT
jgi:protein SCO1/2